MNSMLTDNKVILGLMRLNKLDVSGLENLIKGAIDLGIKYFDISDIYGRGECERKLGEVLKKCPELRSQMIIQTKCGLVKRDVEGISLFDLSYSHIKEACEASLKRMNLSYIDYYLLHRPDILMEPEEINQAIKELVKEKKIGHFGVSNFSPSAIEYLQTELKVPVEVNQVQLGIAHLNMVAQEMNMNLENSESVSHDNGLFFFLKRNDIALQCWSPYQYGFFEGTIFNSEKYQELNVALETIANKYGVSKCAIATAFLFRLGKNIQVITGSTSLEHIKETLDGSKINLSREEFYFLYRKAGYMLP